MGRVDGVVSGKEWGLERLCFKKKSSGVFFSDFLRFRHNEDLKLQKKIS